jgi:CheY-like chemotaxis protein
MVCKIALIDDVPDSAELLKFILEATFGAGEVAWFNSGESFLSAFTRDAFQVILLDLSMPDMDGFQVFDELRKIDPVVPVLAVTGHVYDEDKRRVLRHGFSAHIARPIIDLEGFCNLVRHYVSKQNEESA